MTIKRKLALSATTTLCALALTVPMTFAACPIASDCECQQKTATPIVTPSNATCEKCHQSPCACEKKNFFSNLFDKNNDCDCETGAAAPCGCEEKKNDCGCEKKQDDCGCTGGAAPCIETTPYNQQTYAYPNSIYSNSNHAQVGDYADAASINESGSLLTPNNRTNANCGCTGAAAPIYRGVPVECECPTGGAAPVINSNDLPKYNCEAAPNVYSNQTMDIIEKEYGEEYMMIYSLYKYYGWTEEDLQNEGYDCTNLKDKIKEIHNKRNLILFLYMWKTLVSILFIPLCSP